MRRLPHANDGFTLLELLIAVSIFALLAAGMASLLRAGIQIKQRTQSHQTRMQAVETVLEDVGDHLRNAVGGDSDGFRGTRDEISFPTRRIAWDRDGKHTYQLRRMTYRSDAGTGRIFRTETDPQTALSTAHLLSESGARLRFEYRTVDEETGARGWAGDWAGDDGPAAVRVELVFDEARRADDVWTRVVALPRVADPADEPDPAAGGRE